MNKTFLYVASALLATLVALLISVIVYESFYLNEFVAVSEKKHHVSKTIARLKPEEKTDVLSIATEIDDYMSSQKYKDFNATKVVKKPACLVPKIEPKTIAKVFLDNTPRLAIIMDDIATLKHVEAFKKIVFPMTPSLFPSTTRHMQTPELAKTFKHYMVHMPMEAFHFATPEEDTLQVSDSSEVLEEKIAAMYEDFPNAIAINNHTGSKFTSDPDAMDRLFCILDKYDIAFVDSKTASHTRGKEIGMLHNKVVLERNIFLDNEPDIGYILNQLKKAVMHAKKHGTAIAICHPRPETFEALQGTGDLLKDIKMVTIDELLL